MTNYNRGHRLKDMTGKRVGKLTVIERAGQRPEGIVIWRCACDCGREAVRPGNELRRRNRPTTIVSCGCEKRHNMSASHGRHWQTNSRTWRSWNSMLHRRNRPGDPSWPRYGGAGIRVCERWQGERGYNSFVEDMGQRPEGRTLDRVDNDGDYEPSNCRWATLVEQNNNKSVNRIITHAGHTRTLAQWATALGIRDGTIARRIDVYGWPLERALSERPQPRTTKRPPSATGTTAT
jgi:hypothetical protein